MVELTGDVRGLTLARVTAATPIVKTRGEVSQVRGEDLRALSLVEAERVHDLRVSRLATQIGALSVSELSDTSLVEVEVAEGLVITTEGSSDTLVLRNVDLRQVRAYAVSGGKITRADGVILADVVTDQAWFLGETVLLRHVTAVRSASRGGQGAPRTLDILGSTFSEVSVPPGSFPTRTADWNNRWQVEGADWSDATEGLQVDPRHVRVDVGPAADWDLRLAPDSPLRDAGPPDRVDADGSRADIGAYGGRGQR